MDEVAEGAALVDAAVAEEVGMTGDTVVEGLKNGLDDIADIYEGDVLTLETNGKIGVALDADRRRRWAGG